MLYLTELAQIGIGLFFLKITHNSICEKDTITTEVVSFDGTSGGNTHRHLSRSLVGLDLQLEFVHQILQASQILSVFLSLCKAKHVFSAIYCKKALYVFSTNNMNVNQSGAKSLLGNIFPTW